ncbi:hypothetical protein Tco_0552727, partial [Tanacetum coccineum]
HRYPLNLRYAHHLVLEHPQQAVLLCEQSFMLRTSKLESVLRQMHQNRAFSSFFGLSILKEVEENLGHHVISFETWLLFQGTLPCFHDP